MTQYAVEDDERSRDSAWRLAQAADDILAAPGLKPAEIRIILAEARGQEVPGTYREFVHWAVSIGVGRSQAYAAARRRAFPAAWDDVPFMPGDDEEEPEEIVTVPALPPLPIADSLIGQPGTTALYRWYDERDLLLYVGISDWLRSRTGSHVRGSSWMDFAVRSTIERLSTRDDAIEAERIAIATERPLFNRQYNDTPETRRRLVEYLIARNRLDLLVPAVSRG